MRVLIVDDNPVEAALLARMLRELGHELFELAADLAGALETVAVDMPDLVVVDGRLPPTGCLDALRALRVAFPAIRVAIVASLAEIELVKAAMAQGASGAFRRPLLRTEVDRALRDLG